MTPKETVTGTCPPSGMKIRYRRDAPRQNHVGSRVVPGGTPAGDDLLRKDHLVGVVIDARDPPGVNRGRGGSGVSCCDKNQQPRSGEFGGVLSAELLREAP